MQKKLLLLEDVINVGRKGDMVSVKPGYARNFLLPQQKALVADKNIVKIQARLKEERAQQALIVILLSLGKRLVAVQVFKYLSKEGTAVEYNSSNKLVLMLHNIPKIILYERKKMVKRWKKVSTK